MLLRPSEPVVAAVPDGCSGSDASASVDRLFVDAARRRGRPDCPNDVVRRRLPAADCKSVNELDSLTPLNPLDEAFGLLVALWNACDMLHLRRLDPVLVADVGTGNCDSPGVLRPLLDVLRETDIGGACSAALEGAAIAVDVSEGRRLSESKKRGDG